MEQLIKRICEVKRPAFRFCYCLFYPAERRINIVLAPATRYSCGNYPNARLAETDITQAGINAKTNASVLLDLLRGLAALLVLLEHWRNFFFVDFHQLAAHRLWFALPYLLTSAGHQAVVIFFVLSGCLISSSVFRTLERGTWNWPTYLTHRLMRLWVVLLPGLLLCAVWDHVGLHSGRAPVLYGGAFYNRMTGEVAPFLTFKVFFENLFFLQGLVTHTFGSDGALWSLANEFWYYMLFPLGLFALRPRSNATMRLASGILFLLVAWFVRGGVLAAFPIWLSGTLLCFMPTLKLSTTIRLGASAVYVPILFLSGKQTLASGLAGDYLLTLATFLFLWVLLSATGKATPSLGEHTSRTLARFSYTLYVVHMPFLLLLTAFVAGDSRWIPDFSHIVKALGLLILTLAYAYGVASVTEFQTDTWRRWVEGRLKLSPRRDTSTAVTRT